MKVRLVKEEGKAKLLCEDGTICNASSSLLFQFFTNFDKYSMFTGTDGKWNQEYPDMSEYPAATVAYVTDDGRLLVVDPWIMSMAMTPPTLVNGNLITSVDYAKKHRRSREMIQAFINQGRILGAVKIGRQWFIPEDSPYPVDVTDRKPESGRTPCKG